jgi:predicted Zn finger-like uncharacterized protein
MRLICPNCDAEYLVDDAAIPDTGRDVQCSNCGHAWFQLRPEVEAMLAQEEALFGSAEAEPARAPAAAAAAPAAPASAPPAPVSPAPVPPAPVAPPVSAPPPVAGTVSEPVRRNLDESILSVLREEAEREAAARRAETPRAEAPRIEAQVEMGLPEPTPAPAPGLLDATARRLARLKGQDPDARPVPPPKPGSRRELLPDIEEINSSLKPTQRPVLDEDGEEILPANPGSGFRSGFLLMLILAAALVAAYVMAPKIAQQFPGAQDAMTAYVAQIDALRLWLDGVLRGLTEQLQSVTGPSSAP